ncbi:hypothetical protein ACWDTD_10290 [Gordonia sp. NPDC003425]
MNTTVRIERRDRPWLDARTVYLLGPLPVPGIDEVRRRLHAYARLNPNSRITWALSGDRRHWLVRPSLPDDAVTQREWAPRATIEQVLDDLYQDASLPTPVSVVCYPEHIALVSTHGLWDGRNNTAMAEAVAGAAVSADYPLWQAQPGGSAPLLHAAARTFVRHPDRLLAAIRDRPKGTAPTGDPVRMPWAPAVGSAFATVPNGPLDAAVAAAAERGERISRFALLSAMLLDRCTRFGLQIEPTVNIMVDLRKYLGDQWIDGNFVATVPISVDSGVTASEVAATIRSTLKSGRPVAAQVLTSLRVGGRRAPQRPPTSVVRDAPAALTITQVGDVSRMSLPFSDSGPAILAQTAAPAGPTGVTVAFNHSHEVTILSACAHRNVVDMELLNKVFAAMAEDPGRPSSAGPGGSR